MTKAADAPAESPEDISKRPLFPTSLPKVPESKPEAKADANRPLFPSLFPSLASSTSGSPTIRFGTGTGTGAGAGAGTGAGTGTGIGSGLFGSPSRPGSSLFTGPLFPQAETKTNSPGGLFGGDLLKSPLFGQGSLFGASTGGPAMNPFANYKPAEFAPKARADSEDSGNAGDEDPEKEVPIADKGPAPQIKVKTVPLEPSAYTKLLSVVEA